MISRDEFAAFQQYVKEEFKYLKTMVQDNFKTILKAVSSEENIPDEDIEYGPLHDMEQKAEGGRGPAKSTFLFSNTSRAQRQCIYVDSDEQEILCADNRAKSHTIPDNMASRDRENTSKEINDNEINVENQSHGQAKTLCEEKTTQRG